MLATGLNHISSYAYQTGNTEQNPTSKSLTQKLSAESQKQFDRKIDERKAAERQDLALKPQYEIASQPKSLDDIVRDQVNRTTYAASGLNADAEIRKGQLINTSA